MKIIIIGSGIAGLTAGAYLACEGNEVIIYEQFPKIGGVTATIKEKGFSWDLGPLLLGGIAPHESLGKILAELGLADKITLIYEDRGQSFPDFQVWRQEEYKGPYWRKDYFKELFPEDSEGLDKYYEFYDKLVELGYLMNELPFLKGLKAITTKLKLLFKFLKVKKFAKWSAAEVLDYYFKSPKLKAVFTGILADIVTKPSEFPGLGIPLFNIETAFDKRIPTKTKWGMLPEYHYIKNGCGELVKAFATYITDHGGKIQTNSKVQKIIIENNQAKGVQLENGNIINCDLVIASGGIFNTFFKLVGKENLPEELIQQIENKKLMESIFMVHLGIDFDPSKFQRAALCYYYLTYDIEKAIGEMREGIYHEGKDGFLIYIPSMHSPDMAPPGKHAVTIYTVGPHELKEGTWEERREEMADKLIMEAEKIIPGLYEGSEVK
ncbi:MAG: phytoene desaturase family protein, partial [Promethearchaeota archaeon]